MTKSAVRRVLKDPYFQAIFGILLGEFFYVLTTFPTPSETVLLGGATAVSVLIILRALDSMESALTMELSGIRGVLTEIRNLLGRQRSYVWVKPKCTSIKVSDKRLPCTIYVKCEKALMTWHGCPEPCSGYVEATPTGKGTLGGMIVGGLLGLIGGPLGVILGGLAGGALGTVAETASLRTQLEVEISSCKARGLEPEIVIVEA